MVERYLGQRDSCSLTLSCVIVVAYESTYNRPEKAIAEMEYSSLRLSVFLNDYAPKGLFFPIFFCYC